MATPFWERVKEPWAGFSRRDLFRQGGLLAVAQALGGSVQRAVAAPLDIGPDMYRSIGVRPVINARGTFTIITGSQTLPEVKHAMDLASRSFVDMDELMEGVGKRLAELSGAEWGIVTAGCCAAVTHCTCSAIAGGNPERMQRLPTLALSDPEKLYQEGFISRVEFEQAQRRQRELPGLLSSRDDLQRQLAR